MNPQNVKVLRARYIKLEAELEQAWAELEELRADIKKLLMSELIASGQRALAKEVLIVASLELERRHVLLMLINAEGV